ncbi:MAG: enoyl-CoA hydratase/isomerase family protein [Alphaproteobacteria bacterium]|nr:enoyl-CoA hydratase/isomerase family protein [Alphaproteobacteria bacterium]
MAEATLFEKREHVAILTLNRPERLNAIGPLLRSEVQAHIEEVTKDDETRVLIVTGAGKGFCSGADLSGGGPPPRGTSQNERLDEEGWVGRWAKLWAGLDKPVIAAVNGIAAGAGMSTALAADLRIGSEYARFKTVFIERSLSPDSGMSYFLPRIVGYARAADLIFTSRAVDAEEAFRLGLLDRLVKHDVLIEEAVRLAEQMTQWPPLALRASKRVLQRNADSGLDEALRYESVGLGFARRAANDAREAMLAFREKRQPRYTGS